MWGVQLHFLHRTLLLAGCILAGLCAPWKPVIKNRCPVWFIRVGCARKVRMIQLSPAAEFPSDVLFFLKWRLLLKLNINVIPFCGTVTWRARWVRCWLIETLLFRLSDGWWLSPHSLLTLNESQACFPRRGCVTVAAFEIKHVLCSGNYKVHGHFTRCSNWRRG